MGAELELCHGEGRSARLVVLLKIDRYSHFRGCFAQSVCGPWIDPDDAKAELEEVRRAMTEGDQVALTWAAVAAGVPVAAYLEDRPS